MAAICSRVGSEVIVAGPSSTAGVADDVAVGNVPINGLRHWPGETSGWFLWAGEGGPSEQPDYFKPTHIGHLIDRCPEAMRYLALAPGWRFLIAPGYEDVWFDETLLDHSV